LKEENDTVERDQQVNRIQFGTDGWRAIIAEDFSFLNVRRVAQALSDYLYAKNLAGQGVAIGYDVRFQSDRFARSIAEVLASNAIPVQLSHSYIPTPALSYAVVRWGLAGGIMVTASHNPYFYNGIKFKGGYGGSALPLMTSTIEKYLDWQPVRHEPQLIRKYIHEENFFSAYRQQLLEYINQELLSRFRGQIILNPMHGAGSKYFSALLSHLNLDFRYLNDYPDPLFGGTMPEPIPANLKNQAIKIRSQKAVLGLATDGDADRFAVLDKNGNFVQLHDLMPLLFRYLLESRSWSGNVVRTTSMANTIDRMAHRYQRRVIEVPVGFKNICEQMLHEDILIGGEESGGFGFKGHIPERDGLLAALLVVEMLAAGQGSISDLVAELRREFGPFYYRRFDQPADPTLLYTNLTNLSTNPPAVIAGLVVESIATADGLKIYFTDHSWMLLRVSQTEPLGRIYVGSDAAEKVESLIKAGVALLTSL
jgi:phosphomannomutase